MRNNSIKKITLSGMFLALCLYLPFLTGQIPQVGNALSPMHVPVLLCGFVCGWQYGLVVGAIAPLLRFGLFGMPPIYPIGVAMSFELATYGALAGLMYHRLPKRGQNIYLTLITAMLTGRVVWGIARFVLARLNDLPFTLQMFLSGAFVTAVPGIVLHIALIPLLVIALQKAGLMFNEC